MNKNKKKTFAETFGKLSEEYLHIESQVRKVGMEIIKTAVDKNEGRLSLEEIYEEHDYEDSVCVTYDGGNHPEYAANPYSLVNALYIKDGKIAMECEDSDEYYFDSVTTDEVQAIANFLLEYGVVE